MAATYPASLSPLPLQSQVSAYFRPFLAISCLENNTLLLSYLTEQYQTITPNKSLFTASLASSSIVLELEDPLQPSNILSLGTSTLEWWVQDIAENYNSYLDRKSLPHRGTSHIILKINKCLCSLIHHQPYCVCKTITAATRVPASIYNIYFCLHLQYHC